MRHLLLKYHGKTFKSKDSCLPTMKIPKTFLKKHVMYVWMLENLIENTRKRKQRGKFKKKK